MLAKQSKTQYMSAFEHLYEHSPWVADRVFDQVAADDAFDDVVAFHQLLSNAMLSADTALQDELILAHPMLVARRAPDDNLSDFSADEQHSAGLGACTDAEIETFESLNKQYLNKFGFPFILAIKGRNKMDIQKNFEMRLSHEKTDERQTALEQINQIARLRLKEIYGV